MFALLDNDRYPRLFPTSRLLTATGLGLGITNTNPHTTYIKYVKHVSRRKDDNEYVSGANMPAKNDLRLSVHIVLPGYLVNSFTPFPVCASWKSWKTTSQFIHPVWARDGRSSAHARVLCHVVTDMSDDSYFTSQRENWENSNAVPR